MENFDGYSRNKQTTYTAVASTLVQRVWRFKASHDGESLRILLFTIMRFHDARVCPFKGRNLV